MLVYFDEHKVVFGLLQRSLSVFRTFLQHSHRMGGGNCELADLGCKQRQNAAGRTKSGSSMLEMV